MIKKLLFSGIIIFLLSSCCPEIKKSEEAKVEILKAEKSFAALCKQEGIQKAFTAYAHPNAIILASEKLIKGKAEIEKHYSKPTYKTCTLEWEPDLIDASESGDLGYTYGHYIFTKKDSTGKEIIFKGIFHTVWKKYNNEWKFIWDN